MKKLSCIVFVTVLLLAGSAWAREVKICDYCNIEMKRSVLGYMRHIAVIDFNGEDYEFCGSDHLVAHYSGEKFEGVVDTPTEAQESHWYDWFLDLFSSDAEASIQTRQVPTTETVTYLTCDHCGEEISKTTLSLTGNTFVSISEERYVLGFLSCPYGLGGFISVNGEWLQVTEVLSHVFLNMEDISLFIYELVEKE